MFLSIWAIYYKRNVFSVQKISLPIQASENLNALAWKPFFHKFTFRGKRASTYVSAWETTQTSTSLGSLHKFEVAAGEFKGALGSGHPLILSPVN